MNQKLLLFLTVPPGLALVGALIAAPNLMHVLDQGRVTATISEIARGKLASRNVNVSAQVLVDRGLRYTVTEEKSQTSPKVSFYTPLSGPGGEDGPTQVVLLSYGNEVTDAAERPGMPLELEGTVRDALWEGPPSEVKEALQAIHPLAPGAKVLEVRGPRSTSDRLWAYGAPLAGLLLGLLSAAGAGARKTPAEASS